MMTFGDGSGTDGARGSAAGKGSGSAAFVAGKYVPNGVPPHVGHGKRYLAVDWDDEGRVDIAGRAVKVCSTCIVCFVYVAVPAAIRSLQCCSHRDSGAAPIRDVRDCQLEQHTIPRVFFFFPTRTN